MCLTPWNRFSVTLLVLHPLLFHFPFSSTDCNFIFVCLGLITFLYSVSNATIFMCWKI
ncbi:hypothetical protein HanRHA438_Chr06g0276111 [Helianthus annuus]|nr:hypothetical protein HanRHA438_Chr06g0276111 [Helianthus annuus]